MKPTEDPVDAPIPISVRFAQLFLTPDDYLQVVRDRWLTAIVGLFVGTTLGFMLGFITPPTYQARADIELTVAAQSSSAGELASAATLGRKLAVLYSEVATSGDVLAQAASLAHTSAERARTSTQAFAVVGTPIVRVVAVGATAEDAVDLASAVARTTRATFDASDVGPPSGSARLITAPASNVIRTTPSAVFFGACGAVFGLGIGLLAAFVAGTKRRQPNLDEMSRRA